MFPSSLPSQNCLPHIEYLQLSHFVLYALQHLFPPSQDALCISIPYITEWQTYAKSLIFSNWLVVLVPSCCCLSQICKFFWERLRSRGLWQHSQGKKICFSGQTLTARSEDLWICVLCRGPALWKAIWGVCQVSEALFKCFSETKVFYAACIEPKTAIKIQSLLFLEDFNNGPHVTIYWLGFPSSENSLDQVQQVFDYFSKLLPKLLLVITYPNIWPAKLLVELTLQKWDSNLPFGISSSSACQSFTLWALTSSNSSMISFKF